MPPKKDVPSFTDIEKSMTQFSGDDTYPLSVWLDEFEDAALLMNWTDIEKLIYAKRLLTGTAKLFLRSLGCVKDYEKLKRELEEEFGCKLNSAAIHKKLSSRKMKKDETYQQYFLHMKECALHGNIEDEALMEYVIDGILDSEASKSILYGASDMKEFRKKLEIYKSMKEKCQARPDKMSTQPTRIKLIKRCFKCGDQDHETSTCTKGIKCFRCNQFGHKGMECTESYKIIKSLNIQVKSTKTKTYEEDYEIKAPCKKIKINDVDSIAMIDTGSDTNLIKLSEVKKVVKRKTDYDKETKIRLIGIAGKEVSTEGILNANVKIDNHETEMKIHVVQDDIIPVNIKLGNPILKDFEVHFTADGIFMDKITNNTLPVKEKKDDNRNDIPKKKDIVKTTTEHKPDTVNKAQENNSTNMTKLLREEEPYDDDIMKRRIVQNKNDGMRKDVRMKSKVKAQNEVIKKIIEDVKKYNEKKDELRVKMKESNGQIKESTSNYDRKRKKVNNEDDCSSGADECSGRPCGKRFLYSV